MLSSDRRIRLLELIRIKGFATLPDLTERLGVSESTIRRDLNVLESEGSAKRTHGGVIYTGPSPKLPHFEGWQRRNWDRKKAVAIAAAELVQPGETILLDGGSTTYELAQRLLNRSLQVITNSLPVANLFSRDESADLVLVGGVVQDKTGVTLGPHATAMLKTIRCRQAFISGAGITEAGLFNSNMLLVETERAMMNCADTTTVVADSSKFGQTSLSHVCELSALDRVVADDGLPEGWSEILSANDVELKLASETVKA